MPNSFLYNALTLDGMQLIARATAANKLIITGTKSCTLAASSLADLASKPLSWYDGKAGEIHAVSATGNVARIVAQFKNAGTGQIAKSFCITAKIEGDETSVVLAALSDPNAEIYLPGEDDLAGGVDIPFAVTVTANNTVEVTPGASAALADLDRFVSMYSAANSSVGEDQTILGAKTFSDDATFAGGVGVAGALSVGGDVSTWGGLTAVGSLSVGAGAAISGGAVLTGGDVLVEVPYTGGISTSIPRGGQYVEFLQQNRTAGDGGAKFLFQFRSEIPGQSDVVYAWDMRNTSLTNAAATISVYSVTASTAAFTGTVSVGGLSGLAPAWDADAQAYIVPVGCTIPAFVKDTAIQNPSWGVGKSFTLGADDARTATWNVSLTADQYPISAGTYVTLTGGSKQSAAGHVNYMILMRIS